MFVPAPSSPPAARRPFAPRGRRWAVGVGLALLLLVVLPSFPEVRAWLVAPLFVHHPQAKAEVAYVMADGYAYLERLRAAADLYHLHQVDSICLPAESRSSGYDFVKGRSLTVTERAADYLQFHGVPPGKIETVPIAENVWLGSFEEAQSFLDVLGKRRSVMVVTSAPHTRRSLLSFRRALPDDITCSVYAATPPAESAEIHLPIWHEYVKLAVYYLFAH